ncbi:unnamed protein product [[Candida] boidinii]|uniref:Acetylspermidine oxidase n=1 Tax=Candida boidinii TaxID=5477 RepID=Q9P4V7_CANBO|nr:oxidoreductase activity protein [[Candida] boidinii]BAA97653.1 acetylspermidine oxidase [[Candida] boidinii]GME67116.1 unnamed protein product [[Candida] boidinii]GME92610.1 unnamed protein product [[Candida] boidinii]
MTTVRTDAIVIGAGIAGVKASIELTKAGVSNIILEARDRTGGRLNTVKTPNGRSFDLGASWFHDCLDNPLFEKTIAKGDIKFYFDDASLNLYNKDGYIHDDERLVPIFEEMQTYLETYWTPKSRENDVSIREAAYQYLLKKKNVLTDFQLKNAPQLLRSFELWIGSSWDILSARHICGDKHLGRNAFCLDGWSSVYNNELAELSQISGCGDDTKRLETSNKLYLNTEVKKITFSDWRKEITIKTKNTKTNKIDTYICKYIICTAPLSILKLQKNEVGSIEWSPKLPKQISSALDNLSFSALGKILFEFDEVFWPKDSDRFFCLPDYDAEMYNKVKRGDTNSGIEIRTSEKDIKSAPDAEGFTHPVLFLNVYRMNGAPALACLISNPLTKWIEADPQNRAWPVIKPLLAKIVSSLPNAPKEIPAPKSITCTNWTTDPYARGSYTGLTVHDEFEDGIQTLIDAKGIFDGKGRVRFAGEHCILQGSGCAHGAWRSGAREAAEIVKRINNSKL